MMTYTKRMTILILVSFIWLLFPLAAQDTLRSFNPDDFPSFQDNETCLACHGSGFYRLHDTITGMQKRQAMCQDYFVSREKFYNSVHRSFSCTDCHSYEYMNFPHAISLRFEPAFACIDCHGGDETYAQYHFEEIESEYQASVHASINHGEFTCWKCHDPHGYVPLARRDTFSGDFIVKSNQMCLECHGNVENLQLLTDRELYNVISKHDWLPNQSLHFQSVRCIECHSALNDSILIAHKILPADSAISDCIRCHSQNSVLMGSLYKFRIIESRKSSGFVNAAIIENNSYVIGANRSRFMNIASILIFILAVLAMAVHTAFRIRKSKN